MRGDKSIQQCSYSYRTLEDRIPVDHPLRTIHKLTKRILEELSPEFDTLYSRYGRPSIPPEKLLRAMMLQYLYSIRSERLLVERLDYDMLFRWFVGLGMDDYVWHHSVFSKNRDRLLEGDIADKFLSRVIELAREEQLLSDEHFTVDGTLVEAWASQKSFKNKDGSSEGDGGNFRGEQRKNDTHESTTDPEARLYKKSAGSEAKLSYLGHIMIDNQNGLVVETSYTQSNGTAEREAAVNMVTKFKRRRHRITLGADKAYDTRQFVSELRTRNVTPHVTQNQTNRTSAIDGRTTRHSGYQKSQFKRGRIEKAFGWIKTVALLRKTRHKGVKRGGWVFTFVSAVYNLVRMKNLVGNAA